MPKKVLLLTYAFPPMAVAEAVLSVKRMGSLPNYEVDVICAEPFRNWMGNDHSLEDYAKARFARIDRVRLPTLLRALPLSRLGLASRCPDIFRFLNWATRRAALAGGLDHYDAIVTWSQWHSIHLVGLALKKAAPTLPWIAHFSDPWVDNPFIQLTGVAVLLNRRMERSVFAGADRLLFTSQETVDLVMAKYPDSLVDKARVLPHAYDPALYPEICEGVAGRPLTLRYLGNFYGSRTPEPLFRALAEIHCRGAAMLNEVRVELIGNLSESVSSSPSLAPLPDGLVRFVPPVEYLRSLELMVESDVLLVIDAPTKKSVFLPSKLIDYVGARRPIFGITPPGASANLIGELGGMVADPTDISAIAEGLRAVIADLRQGGRRVNWGDESVRTRYEASAVARRFEDMIGEVRNNR